MFKKITDRAKELGSKTAEWAGAAATRAGEQIRHARSAYKRCLSLMLAVVMVTALLPLGSFSFTFVSDPGDINGGRYTDPDGTEYAVLYNDYITLYVSRDDGSFAILPAAEAFDHSKPRSHAVFQIDGGTYRYGIYYPMLSGLVSFAPEVVDDNLLRSDWKIGDFVISQIFSIVAENEHDNSYAVKIGYAAQYFGEGIGRVAGRILLDTQFTPDESVPVVVMDSAENLALVETEAIISPVPVMAMISREFIEEANIEAEELRAAALADYLAAGAALAEAAETCSEEDEEYIEAKRLLDKAAAVYDAANALAVYEDMPAKGYIATGDNAFATPDVLNFAQLGAALAIEQNPGQSAEPGILAETYAFTPDWDTPLFDGSGADSAVLLYWNECAVTYGQQAAYGTTYGFYDLEKGKPKFDPLPELTDPLEELMQNLLQPDAAAGVSALSALSGDIKSAPVRIEYAYIPEQFFTVVSTMANTTRIIREEDGLPIHTGTLFDVGFTGEFQVGVSYNDSVNDGVSELIKAAYTEYQVQIRWQVDGEFLGRWFYDDFHDIGEYAVIKIDDIFALKPDHEDAYLNVSLFIDDAKPADGYAYLMLHNGSAHMPTLPFSMALTGSDAARYIPYNFPWDLRSTQMYVIKEGTSATLTYEVADIDNKMAAPKISGYDKDWNEVIVPYTTLTEGPVTYSYSFTIPSNLQFANIYAELDDSIVPGPKLHPVNVVAYYAGPGNAALQIQAENALWYALGGDGLNRDLGVIWAEEGSEITVNPGFNSTYPGGSLIVYEAGTNNVLISSVTTGFTMQDKPVDLVYENGAFYRVFTEVTGPAGINGDEATVTINSYHGNGATPGSGDPAYIFVTNIKDGYRIKSVTAKNNSSADVQLDPQPGGIWTFTMPADTDVAVTVELEAIPAPKPFYNVTVKPLAADGELYFDVAFWTDEASGERAFHEVDEAGRISRIREGTTVYYALYPTRWVNGIKDWTVSSFTINGVTPAGFEGINTGEPGKPHEELCYFPYTYSPDDANATAGKFIMPAQDVVIELGGHHIERTQAMKLEAYTPDGVRFLDAEWGVYSTSLNAIDYQPGLENLIPGYSALVFVPRYRDIYEVTRVQLVLANGSVYDITNSATSKTYQHVRYEIDSSMIFGSTLRLYYTDARRTVTIAGFTDDEVRVSAQIGNSTSYGREFSIMPDSNGEYILNVTLQYMADRGSRFTLGTNASGATVTANPGSLVSYQLKLTSQNARVAIVQQDVPANAFLHLTLINSANSANFKEVIYNATDYIDDAGNAIYHNLQKIFTQDPASRITKITFTGRNTGTKFERTAAPGGNLAKDISRAFSFPSEIDRGVKQTVEAGTHMQINLRALFDIAGNYIFPDDDYSVYIEWTWGYQWAYTGERTHTVTLDKNYFSPNELTNIGIVQDPDKNWKIVTGDSYELMMLKAKDINSNGPLLTFYNENGFDTMLGPGKYRAYAGTKEVIMNGHAYFKESLGRGFGFVITESDGSVKVETDRITLGRKSIPFFIPCRIGNFGTDELIIELEKGREYIIPEEYPDYDNRKYPTVEQAKEEWLEQVEAYKENMVQIRPNYRNDETFFGMDFSNGSISIIVAGFEIPGGLTMNVREMYLLGHGFDIGGLLNIQMPFFEKPIARVEIISIVTDNTSKVIPIDHIWAEGEVNLTIPFGPLEGLGGYAYALFDTFTQSFGFEAGLNAWIVEFEGSVYITRSSRIRLPVLNSFEVAIAWDVLAVGLGAPPAPAQVVELQGVNVGIYDLADFFDYDLAVSTIPRARVKGGVRLTFVEFFTFDAAIWVESMSLGATLSGSFGIGPFDFPMIEEISVGGGMKDGPYDTAAKKRSIMSFFDFRAHLSVLGACEGALGFYMNQSISPALWENKGGFSSLSELLLFLDQKTSMGGEFFGSVNVFNDLRIASVTGTIDLTIGPGDNLLFQLYPFWPQRFEISATIDIAGIYEGTFTYDFLKAVNSSRVKDWAMSKVQKKLEQISGSGVKGISTDMAGQYEMQLMAAYLTNTDLSGAGIDTGYKGEIDVMSFGDTAASSERRGTYKAPALLQPLAPYGSITPYGYISPYGITPLGAVSTGINPTSILTSLTGITQDANIRVDYDGSAYTHTVTVPAVAGNIKGYTLMLEGVGWRELTGIDIRVFKPNGQALIIREVPGEGATADQAQAGYNAVLIDGVLMLSLSDYKNINAGEVTGVEGTLEGTWQVVSSQPFKSRLVELKKLPGVSTAEINGNILSFAFENITVNSDYYYDIILERKGDPNAAPLETPMTLIKNQRVTSLIGTLNLTSVPNGSAGTYNVSEILASGEWYAKVVLRRGGNESFGGESLLMTEYVSHKYTMTPYTVKNWFDALAPSWTANLTAKAGGNASIALEFAPAAAPADMLVYGYNVVVYNASNGEIATNMEMGVNGSASIAAMKYDMPVDTANIPSKYQYSIPNVPAGTYTVGVSPIYAEKIEKTDGSGNVIAGEYVASPSVHKGAEVKAAGTVTVAEFAPPVIELAVSGGSIVEENGAVFIYAGPGAVLTAVAGDGVTVSFCEIDGTVLSAGTALADIDKYAGQALMISARNPGGDTSTEFVMIYGVSAPALVPDNFDAAKGTYVFTANRSTGSFTVTGMTDPGAVVEGVMADSNGRFEISGSLPAGRNSEVLCLTVANEAGMVTTREVEIVRASSGSGTATPAPGAGDGADDAGDEPDDGDKPDDGDEPDDGDNGTTGDDDGMEDPTGTPLPGDSITSTPPPVPGGEDRSAIWPWVVLGTVGAAGGAAATIFIRKWLKKRRPPAQ